MTCERRYDLRLTDSNGDSFGFLCDWTKGGAGLKISPPADITKGTFVSTKGDYGVRDVNDYWRIIQTDWSEGAGQELYDRDADSENAFLTSRFIDVSSVGELRLGPAVAQTAEADQLPAIIAFGVDSNSVPRVWTAVHQASTATARIKQSIDGATWTALSASGPASDATAFATDGEYGYAVCGGVVYRFDAANATYSTDASNAGITHLAFCMGNLYAAQGTAAVGGTDAKLGAFDNGAWTGAGAKWTALSPAVSSAIEAAGATFGLVSSGNYVYWGVTNGMVTKLYKAQRGATNDTLEQVAVFPSGFKGASLYAYLDTIYVGGHFDWASVNTGLGAIYAVVDGTPALLTDIGESKDEDNRVLAMCAYERSLYFVSHSNIWRWDLVRGGYSHYAGPLTFTATDYGDITWTGTWACTYTPGTGGEPLATSSGSGVSTVSGGVLTLHTPHGTYAQWRSNDGIASTASFADTTGETLEVDIPALGIHAPDNGDFWQYKESLFFGIEGSAYEAYVEVATPVAPTSSDYYWVGLRAGLSHDGTDALLGSALISSGQAHTLRLTLKQRSGDSYAKASLYDGTTPLLSAHTTIVPTSAKHIWFKAMPPASSGNDDTRYASVSEVRWTDDADYVPGYVGSVATGVSMACWRDHVIVACTGVGVTYTAQNTYKETTASTDVAYLISSKSSGNMPTVDKWFKEIDITLADVVPSTCTLGVTAIIDGLVIPLTQDTSLGDDMRLVFPIGFTGRTIQYMLTIANSGTSAERYTPRIAEVAELFTPVPRPSRTYTYFLRIWSSLQDRDGQTLTQDTEGMMDFLEANANTFVLVERPSGDSFTGRIDGLEMIEASPSSVSDNREGLYQVEIVRVS